MNSIDVEAIRRLAAYDERTAQDVFYRHFERVLRRHIRRWELSADDCDDVIANTFFRFFRTYGGRLGEVGITLSPIRLLIEILKNERKRLLSRGYRAREVGIDSMDDSAEPSTANGDEDRLADTELHCALLNTLMEMAPRSRYVVVKHFYEGHSYESLASELGCSPQTVRRLTRRALIALRATLVRRGFG